MSLADFLDKKFPFGTPSKDELKKAEEEYENINRYASKMLPDEPEQIDLNLERKIDQNF